MGSVQCLYCGQTMADTRADCPHCGAPSHFQKRGENPRRRRLFVALFVLLVLFCIVIAIWLPR